MLIVGLLNSIIDRHRPTWTVAILATAPICDVLVIVASDFVISVAIENKCSSASLSWNKCNG